MADQRKELVDAFPVPDTYVERLGSVEISGSNVRLTFATARTKYGGDVDHEIVLRIVMPIEAMAPALRELLSTTALARSVDAAALLRSIACERKGLLQ